MCPHSPANIIKQLNFDYLLLPNTWVWCNIKSAGDKQFQWRLGRVSFEPNRIPGFVICDVLIPSGESYIPESFIVCRSSIVPYDGASRANQSRLTSKSYPTFSVPAFLLNDLSFLYSSNVISFASLLCERFLRSEIHTKVGSQVLVRINPFNDQNDNQFLNHRYYWESDSDCHPFHLAKKAYNRIKHSIALHRSQSIILIGPPDGGQTSLAISIVKFLSSCFLADGESEISISEKLFIERINAALTLLSPFIQRPQASSGSLTGLVFSLFFDTVAGRIKNLQIGSWATDVSSISNKLRRGNEQPPQIIYHILISTIEFRDNLPPTLMFVSSSDANNILKLLPKPIPDNIKFHTDQFNNIVLSLVTLGYTNEECADLFRVVHGVALIDAAYMIQQRPELNPDFSYEVAIEQVEKVLGLPHKAFDNKKLETLTASSICIYERMLNSIIERLNFILDNNQETRDTAVISVTYSPGFSHVDSGNLFDVIRNVADDVLLRRWFASELPRNQFLFEGIPATDVQSWTDPLNVISLFVREEKGVFALLDEMDSAFRLSEKKILRDKEQEKNRKFLIEAESDTEDSFPIGDPNNSNYVQKLGETFLRKLGKVQSEDKTESRNVLTIDETGNKFSINHTIELTGYSSSQFAIDNSTTRATPELYAILKKSTSKLIESFFIVEDPVLNPGIRSNSVIRSSCRAMEMKEKVEIINQWISEITPSFFIFCFPPNISGDPHSADVNHIGKLLNQYQLTPYCQMQQLFPIQMPFEVFIDNHLILLLNTDQTNIYYIIKNNTDKRRAVKLLLEALLIPDNEYWLGFLMVYFQRRTAVLLERRRKEFLSQFLPAVLRLQKSWNGFLPRLYLSRQRSRIIRIQSQYRRVIFTRQNRKQQFNGSLFLGVVLVLKVLLPKISFYSARKELEKSMALDARKREVNMYRHVAATQIQAWWRSKRAMRKAEQMRYTRLEECARISITNVCRRFGAQLCLFKRVHSTDVRGRNSIIIQSHVRGWRTRKQFSQLICLRSAILPIKRISSVIITVKHRIHMLKLLSTQRICRDAIRDKSNLNFFATSIQKVWRGHFVRSQVKFILLATFNLQLFGHTKLHQTRFQNIISQTCKVQNWFRSILSLKEFPTLFSPKFQRRTKTKETMKYLKREWAGVNLIVFPLRLYQGQFYQSRLLGSGTKGMVLTRVHINKDISSVYPKSWSWPFLQILHHRSRISFNALREANTRYRQTRVADLLMTTKTADLPQQLQTSNKRAASIVYSCLLHTPPTIFVRKIDIGGHHTLIQISEYRIPSKTTKTRSRQDTRECEMVTYLYSYGFNDRGQLGNPMRSSRHYSDPHLTEPIQFVDSEYLTSMDPLTGKLTTRLIRLVNYTHLVMEVGTGNDHCVVVVRNGPTFAWGDNRFGQCGVGPKIIRVTSPAVIESLRGRQVSSISVSPSHSMALANGSVYIWGHHQSIGLETIPPQCNLYYPIKVPLRDPSGLQERCIGIASGNRFNVVLCSDYFTVKIWGANDVGQLGNNKSPIKGTFPYDLLISDIPKNPNAFLRVLSISCGSEFVAACVRPSRGRIFIWGKFRVSENIETPTQTEKAAPVEVNPWLEKRKKAAATPISPTPLASPRGMTTTEEKTSTSSMKAICIPTAVTNECWKDSSIIKACCGHTSNISVVLENGEMYGFEMVEVIWFQREDAGPKKSVPDPIPINTFGARLTSATTAVPKTKSSKRPMPEKFVVLPLKGLYHLKASVFQYRLIGSSNLGSSGSPYSTFNNYGLQVEYALDFLPKSREARLTDNKQDIFKALSINQIVTGAETCISLLEDAEMAPPRKIDPRFLEIFYQIRP